MPVSKHRKKEKKRRSEEGGGHSGGVMSSLRGGFRSAVGSAQKEGPVQKALTYVLLALAAGVLLYRLGILRF
jgi:hypothetical protein